MTLKPESELRAVSGLSDGQIVRISDFLQGAVYSWCKNNGKTWFALRDLMGGENFFWQGTPLIDLYEKHADEATDPAKEAGKDAGWLLKSVIGADRREFETKVEAQVRHYRWTGDDGDI